MMRRTLLLAIPQVLLAQDGPWQQLAQVWNPFAEQLNKGVLDLKLWKHVLVAIDRVDGRHCR